MCDFLEDDPRSDDLKLVSCREQSIQKLKDDVRGFAPGVRQNYVAPDNLFGQTDGVLLQSSMFSWLLLFRNKHES